MTVAAIIEQTQNRWMDQHPLQVYNRAFQGAYCKYYCILLFVYVHLFLHHPQRSWRYSQAMLSDFHIYISYISVKRSKNSFFSFTMNEWVSKRAREKLCVIQLCAHDNIRKNVHSTCDCMWRSSDALNSKIILKGKLLFFQLFYSKTVERSITSANKIFIESQFLMRSRWVGWFLLRAHNCIKHNTSSNEMFRRPRSLLNFPNGRISFTFIWKLEWGAFFLSISFCFTTLQPTSTLSPRSNSHRTRT